MINFRSRVKYTGEANPEAVTNFLKGYTGIVTGTTSFTTEDSTYIEVTFLDDGGTRIVNIDNLEEIPSDQILYFYSP